MTALPPIPTDLSACKNAFDRALYYIALRDRNERRLIAERPPAGVSWSGMSGPSCWTPMSDLEIVKTALQKVPCAELDRAIRDMEAEDIETLLAAQKMAAE